MSGYYDYVLGFIPFALFGITGLLKATGLELTTAVPLGAGVAVLAIGHALFVNAPVDSVPTTQSARTSRNPVNAD